MGEIYEAEDLVLRENVALKFLSRQSIGDELVARRFRREIQLARKVTHSNVCRLFDVFQHRPTSGPLKGEEFTFVTMELLEGETLEAYLKREGPLSEAQASPLIGQMAAALAAAHAAGVIHRDFKSNNVILVANDNDEEAPRAVVTDFGLARSVSPPDPARTPLTGEMKLLGTADYISPEQIQGKEVSPASDIYALGVVIFEMVTGRKPYSAKNPVALITKRLSEPPASPREFAPQLSRRWESAILRCLDDDPGKRFPTPWHVVAELHGQEIVGEPQSSASFLRPAELQHRTPLRLARWTALLLAVSLLVLGAVFWMTRMERQAALPDAFSPQKLTTSPGLELDPTFSPDGTRLAFSSDASGSFELYVQELPPGAEVTRLTFDGGEKFEPAWSPDGERIAYHSKERTGIWVIPAGGGTSIQLTSFGSRPAWSPDGSLIVFQSESSPQLSDTSTPAHPPTTLWVVAIGTDPPASPQPLTQAEHPTGGHGSPAWSPDGRRIVFSSSWRTWSEVWSIDRHGEDLVRVADTMTAYDPAYSAGGERIYFSARNLQVIGLWAVEVAPQSGRPRGDPILISNLGLASIRQIAISRDGTRMAYAAMTTGSNLWSLGLSADLGPRGVPHPLTTGVGRNTRPVFSPDGARIAFGRWQLGVKPDVWVMNADGGEAAIVTGSPANSTHPSWFPTGDRLAFLARRSGIVSLRTVDLDSDRESPLIEMADADWAKISPDGTRVAYHTRAGGTAFNLWVRDLATNETRQLTFDQEMMGFPCWSPNGEWLTFQKKRGENSFVMVIRSSGGKPTQLTSESGQSWPFSFSPDGDKVAFAAFREGGWNLWWVSRIRRQQRQLTHFARLNTYVRYPAWSPQGDQIIFERAETTGDIWFVENVR
ncbi:MAG: protein kinase [bacterium]|nr:protein kinase [bacterium]